MWIKGFGSILHICYMLVILSEHVAGYHYLHESQLHSDMADGYQRDIRPALENEAPVLVKIYPTVVRIHTLDEGSATLETTISLSMSWTDSRLKWHPSDYGQITQTHVSLDKLWKPDIDTSNGLSTPRDGVTMAAVSSSGTVAAVLIHRSISYCDIDLTRFPHDTQTCVVLFGSWIYSYSQLALQFWDGNKYDMIVPISDNAEKASSSKTWAVGETTAKAMIYNVTQECCPDDPFVQLKINLQLERRSNYLSQVLVCQLVVLVLLLPLQFLLPHAQHDRTLYGFLVLLGDLLIIHELIQLVPHITSSVSHIGNLYLANLCFALAALVMSTVSTWAAHQQTKGQWMASPLRQFMLAFGRICCVRATNNSSRRGKFLLKTDAPSDHVDNQEELNTFRELHEPNDNNSEPPIDQVDSLVASSVLTSRLKQTNGLLKDLTRSFRDKETSRQNGSEWMNLAAVLDRLCFVIFCVVSIVMIVLVIILI